MGPVENPVENVKNFFRKAGEKTVIFCVYVNKFSVALRCIDTMAKI